MPDNYALSILMACSNPAEQSKVCVLGDVIPLLSNCMQLLRLQQRASVFPPAKILQCHAQYAMQYAECNALAPNNLALGPELVQTMTFGS